jgi:hypothetical protein
MRNLGSINFELYLHSNEFTFDLPLIITSLLFVIFTFVLFATKPKLIKIKNPNIKPIVFMILEKRKAFAFLFFFYYYYLNLCRCLQEWDLESFLDLTRVGNLLGLQTRIARTKLHFSVSPNGSGILFETAKVVKNLCCFKKI